MASSATGTKGVTGTRGDPHGRNGAFHVCGENHRPLLDTLLPTSSSQAHSHEVPGGPSEGPRPQQRPRGPEGWRGPFQSVPPAFAEWLLCARHRWVHGCEDGSEISPPSPRVSALGGLLGHESSSSGLGGHQEMQKLIHINAVSCLPPF